MQGRSFADLDEQLFMGDDARRRFVTDRLIAAHPSTDPVEQQIDAAGIGTNIVWHDGNHLDAVITFIRESELDAKRFEAYKWMWLIWSVGIDCTVVAYTLDDDHGDFETLQELLPPWFPEAINYGDRIAYKGLAYLAPGVDEVTVKAEGEFAIGEAIADMSDAWYCIEDVDTGDELWVTEPLLYTSRFLTDEKRRADAKPDREPHEVIPVFSS